MSGGNGKGNGGNGKPWGVNSEYGKLHDVLLCVPENFKWLPTSSISKATLRDPDSKYDLQTAMRQHREMTSAYEDAGAKVHYIVTERRGGGRTEHDRHLVRGRAAVRVRRRRSRQGGGRPPPLPGGGRHGDLGSAALPIAARPRIDLRGAAAVRHGSAATRARPRPPPDNAEVWCTLGAVYSAAGRPEEALRALAEAARLEPGMAAAHADMCRLLSELGRYNEAAVACRSAVESDATDVAAWLGLGVASYQLGAYDEASAAFREALVLEPGNQGAVYGLGLSLAYAGDRDGAVAQYLRLKELDPALAQDLYRRIFP